MFKKVFISYASEDFDYANKLYNFLVEKGLEPWMDKKKLLPGQKFDFEIQTNLRRADFVILLLSNLSVSKRGYVQKEFKLAVKICEEKLDSDIFVIPVKIDKCIVPDSLTSFQWIEYDSENSFENIFTAITLQQKVLHDDYAQKESSKDPLAYVDNRLEYTYGDKSPKQIVEVQFPVMINNINQDFEELNLIFRKNALDAIQGARSNYFDYLKDFNDNDFMRVDSTRYTTMSIHYLSEKFVSFSIFSSFYNTGAAHGYFGSSGKNYILKPLRRFDLKELCSDYKSALMILKEIVYNRLVLKAKTNYDIDDPKKFFSIGEMLQPEEAYFKNYYFKENSIVFVYNPYELTPFSFGDHHVEVSFDELLQAFPAETKVQDFIIGLITKD